jgi:peptidoglycan/LPS O-acetylase OafA/YrhL
MGQTTIADEQTTPARIAALDGLRGLAILMILMLHGGAPDKPSWGPAYQVAHSTIKSLWCGVDLFFVLSGFLITGILIDSRNKTHYFQNFFARRFLRIFPIYYLTLAVVLLVGGPFASMREDQVWFWTYTANLLFAWQGDWPAAGGHVWSLAIEEQFYLLWPIVVWLCAPRKLIVVCATMVFGALAMRIAMVSCGASPVSVYTFTPCRLDTLAIGSLVAIAMRDPRGSELLQRYTPRVFGLAVAAVTGIIVATSGFRYETPVVTTAGISLIAIAFAALLVFLVRPQPVEWLTALLQGRVLQWFGRISYGLYLYHWFIYAAIRSSDTDFIFGEKSIRSSVMRAIVYYISSVLVAYVSCRFIEKPILKWKDKFTFGPVPVNVNTRQQTNLKSAPELAPEPLS